jgi:hypothetical protein
MAFTDEDIRAIVRTGQYSDPEAGQWIAECLMRRRDKIGRAYFPKVLALDRFRVENGRLVFEDLAVSHQFAPARDYTVQWFRFDNDAESRTPLGGETSLALPRAVDSAGAGEYFAAAIHAGEPAKQVTVYVRKQSNQVEVVGIDRAW